MKKITAFNRLMYVLNPRKSLQEFMNEAENCVREYALHSFGINKVPKIHTVSEYSECFVYTQKIRKKPNCRKINVMINMFLALSSVAAAYIIYRCIS